jgi:hypothetical protein
MGRFREWYHVGASGHLADGNVQFASVWLQLRSFGPAKLRRTSE